MGRKTDLKNNDKCLINRDSKTKNSYCKLWKLSAATPIEYYIRYEGTSYNSDWKVFLADFSIVGKGDIREEIRVFHVKQFVYTVAARIYRKYNISVILDWISEMKSHRYVYYLHSNQCPHILCDFYNKKKMRTCNKIVTWE